jgi:hypothetical protein
MNKVILKNKLDKLGINPMYYSLDCGLKTDALILYKNYEVWEIFYIDERGGRHEKGLFNSENEACNYFLNEFVKINKNMNSKIEFKDDKEIDDLPDVINL